MSAVDAKAIIVNVGVIDNASGPFLRIGSSAQAMGTGVNAGMAKASTGLATFSKNAGKAATFGAAAIAAGLVLSAKAAITFESSFAGVKKTVDTSAEGFERLADGVRQMAQEIPIGVNELNRIMELGGQLGVGAGQLLPFTETIAKIGVTTTLATDEAAMGFARLDNIMQLGGTSYDNMGSAIVDLGNNFAATENEILTFSLRIAPVGATVGLAIDEVLALATAFSSVGIPAERGGTALQKTFIKIASAAQSGGVDLDIFAETAGMTSEAFADLAETDPAESFVAFVTGLGRIKEEGGNVFAVLDQVGLGNERVRATLLAAANAGDILTDALDLSSGAYIENNALNEEAAKRFETTASKAELAKNKINDLAISIGTNLLPVIGNFAGGVIVLGDGLEGLGDAAKSGLALAAGAVTGIGLIAAGHPIIAGIGLFAAAIALIGTAAAEARQHVIDLRTAGESFMGDGDYGGNDSANLIIGKIGGGGLRKLQDWGFTIDDIGLAIRGTDADWENFESNVQDKVGNPLFHGLPSEVNKLENLRREVVATTLSLGEEEEATLRASRAALLDAAAREQMWAAQGEAQGLAEGDGGGSRFMYGSDQLIAPDIVYPAYEAAAEYADDISSALGDYVTIFTESFDEIDERIRGHVDLWYDFGEAIDLSAESIVKLTATLSRQVTAIGSFEALVRGQDLSSVMEEFIRKSFNTPALMEAYVEWSKADPLVFEQTMKDWEFRLSELGQIILEIFTADFPDIDFTAGAELLGVLSGVVDEIVNDPDSNYDPAEAWLGVIYQTLASVDAADFDDVYNMLIGVFGTGGINEELGITAAMIVAVAEALGLLPTVVPITIEFGTEGAIPEGFGGYATKDPSIGTKAEFSALGGNAFADKPYIVGELGPELFVPFNSGTIIPNNKLGGGGNRTTTIYIDRVESNDLPGDISEGLTRASITEQVDMIGAY